ncbi:MAG: LysE family translocator [Chthoniobacterales bacterium]|nr:LysE family translocator [Chthoniobacterales bacterium]
MVVPGPGQMLVLARTASDGQTQGIATSLGLELGTLGHTVAATVGLSALLATSSLAFAVVKYLGAIYLVYLGIRAFRTRPTSRVPDGNTVANRHSFIRCVIQAMATGLLNPKVAIFFLAFLPQFVHPLRGHVALQFLILGLTLASIGFAFDSALAITVAHLGRSLLEKPAFLRWRQRVAGAVLVGLGTKLAFSQR